MLVNGFGAGIVWGTTVSPRGASANDDVNGATELRVTEGLDSRSLLFDRVDWYRRPTTSALVALQQAARHDIPV
jgi:hypothetical protein